MQPLASAGSMRKIDKAAADPDLRAEYDFSTMAGGVRGKYVERYRTGVNLVLLEPEVAEAFPTDAAVNEALRIVMRAGKASRRPRVRAKRLPLKKARP